MKESDVKEIKEKLITLENSVNAVLESDKVNKHDKFQIGLYWSVIKHPEESEVAFREYLVALAKDYDKNYELNKIFTKDSEGLRLIDDLQEDAVYIYYLLPGRNFFHEKQLGLL